MTQNSAGSLPRTIREILLHDSACLAEGLALAPDSARIEVQSLLQQVLQAPRAFLLTHPERGLNEAENARYHALLQRRLAGEPVAYILGEREFFGMKFKVTPDTLIPRPDTELLVELALERIPQTPPGLPLRAQGEARQQTAFRLLDLGAGSGAIALAVAHARPATQVLACDSSASALMVARENAHRLGITNVSFVHSDWFAELGAQRFDLIVSNPPYVAQGDPHLRQGDLHFEPASALASGEDGLHDIRHIVAVATAHLQPGGWLLLEHGYDQAAQVRELLQQAGFRAVFSACDLSGTERVSGGHA
jgi:release factor glutamine methyltransferase